jgi:Predicted hydrolase of alkaline phosphatase superfamily
LLKLDDDEKQFTNHYVGKVLNELKKRNILDETIVVITADHDEAFGEHNRFGHHPYLYDGSLRRGTRDEFHADAPWRGDGGAARHRRGQGSKNIALSHFGVEMLWQVEENEVELYNLQEDPDELNDVSKDHPDIVMEFQEQIEAYLEAAEETDIDLPDIETNTELEQRLRNLGYR